MEKMKKMQSCCSKFASNVNLRKAEVRALAKKAALRDQRGLSIVGQREEIDAAKAELAEAKRRSDDHDAEHAGQPVMA